MLFPALLVQAALLLFSSVEDEKNKNKAATTTCSRSFYSTAALLGLYIVKQERHTYKTTTDVYQTFVSVSPKPTGSTFMIPAVPLQISRHVGRAGHAVIVGSATTTSWSSFSSHPQLDDFFIPLLYIQYILCYSSAFILLGFFVCQYVYIYIYSGYTLCIKNNTVNVFGFNNVICIYYKQ